ncbi:ABC transporter ATP-binding protein [Sulfurimonas sp.]|uniref:energy-coupling factor ABC transporter ATP-binding protein n=1 Tax=Sulfurimonas sp. TaxID=2022749 RepID=UPI0025E6BF5A|nr:ABC transporter ATP-binding protein [Sulfurimonas sp.]
MSDLYKLENVEQHYDGKKVLSIKELTLQDNQIIGFFGPNGSGKSTLFSLLSFINKPTLGNIYYNGERSDSRTSEIRHSVVIVPQNPYLLKRTVYENIIYGLKIRKETKELDEQVQEALNLVGLDSSFSNRKWSQLSGGEAQRVALAARLILKPKVLILDEPTSGVDTNSAQLIKEAILLAKQKYNTTILISSHDHNWLNHICDRRVALFQGELVESGSINLLFAPWKKSNCGNLVKEFIDGQKLLIPNTQDKKRDSVMMINSDYIVIDRQNKDDLNNESTLEATVSSIHQQQTDENLLVEFTVGGVCFNTKLDRNKMQRSLLLPGDNINVSIDTSKVCWI